MNVAIPPWTATGVLPPIDVANPTSASRAPYQVSLTDVVMRFATSVPRFSIAQRLLDYRAALHRMGLTSGFQWIDGSYLEQIELLEGRPPNDVDVVTFVDTASASVPTGNDDDALDNAKGKARFSVDGYFVELNLVPPNELSAMSVYWYSVWSHRRNLEWKGFLQIDLSPAEDQIASAWLAQSPHSVVSGGAP
jgi:hypothetical protein